MNTAVGKLAKTPLDSVVADLAKGEQKWASTTLKQRVELLRRSRATVADQAEAWVETACRIKLLDPDLIPHTPGRRGPVAPSPSFGAWTPWPAHSKRSPVAAARWTTFVSSGHRGAESRCQCFRVPSRTGLPSVVSRAVSGYGRGSMRRPYAGLPDSAHSTQPAVETRAWPWRVRGVHLPLL
jgi:hypothetical protein